MLKLSRLLGVTRRGSQRARRFFDADYYRAEYPDVAAGGGDAFAHYMQHGWREGRNPSAVFSTLYYRDRCLAGTSHNPLLHYAGLSKAEHLQRPTSPGADFVEIQAGVIAPFFDAKAYAEIADLEADDNPLRHYLTQGWKQGVEPSADFSSDAYLQRNVHVRRLGVSPFYHFVSTYPLLHPGKVLPTTGMRTHWTSANPADASDTQVYDVVNAALDKRYYYARQGDVRTSGTDPVRHYLDFGASEDRDPTELFSNRFYRETYAREIGKGVNPFYHYLTVGRQRGYRQNPFGHEYWPAAVAPSEIAWREAKPAADLAAAEIVLIMPVYKGYDDTLLAIHSVLTARQTARFALVVINDCGPEPRLTAALEELSGRGLFAYRANRENLGFVRTCNLGLDLAAGRDVVLLNADIVVYGNWLDRLLRHAADPRVATITPFSNNATICSYPTINVDNRIQLEVTPAELDAYTAVCNAGTASSVPTGVGFCFYMRGTVVSEIGPLDAETFGKGYGEENDFCMRALKRGYVNLLAHDVFVFHSGSVSFGAMLEKKGADIFLSILGKHPDYRKRVETHVAVDPARFARKRLDYYRFARRARGRLALFVTHKWGGGIETHVEDMSRRLAEVGYDVVYLRTAGVAEVEIGLPADSRIDFPGVSMFEPLSLAKDRALLDDLIGWLAPEIVHVHSLARLDWRSTLDVMALIEALPTGYDCTLHDYAAVCHRNHLVRPEVVYCGLPEVEVCRGCITLDAEAEEYVDPADRRERFAAFLAGARRVFSPSHDLAERLGRRTSLPNLVVRPHEEAPPAFDLPDRAVGGDGTLQDTLHVALLGAIGTHKGADVLYNLALDAQIRNLPIRFTIVGYSYDADLMRKVGVRETGRYDGEAAAVAQLRKLKPDIVFLPSIWPETYCYTLSLALAAGIPPVVFDIGAQAERLAATGEGHRLDFGLIEDPQALNAALLALPLDALWTNRRPFAPTRYPDILTDYYGLPAATLDPKLWTAAR